MVEWSEKTQTQTWIYLKDLKQYYTIQVAKYAEVSELEEHPALIWRVP